MAEIEISGPNILYATKYAGKNYYFFGDIHGSFTKSCSGPCRDINNDIDSSCYNVTKFFDLIFKHADEFHRWVDVFFEYSYVQKTGPVGLFNIKAIDSLRSTISTFSSCMARPMIKNSCDYHNVRFHYSDIRSQTYPGQAIPTTGLDFINNEQIRIILVLEQKIDEIYDWRVYLRTRARLIYWFYHDNNDKKLFDIYLKSDEYETDLAQYLNSIQIQFDPETPKEVTFFNEFSKAAHMVSVNRDGKSMSKIRAQFYGLEQQGDDEMSEKIQAFVKNKYQTYRKQIQHNPLGAIELLAYQTNDYDRFMDVISVAHNLINYEHQFTLLTASLMDAYTLARMFRRYPEQEHIESSVVITYTGAAHAKHYAEFFKTYLGSKILTFGNMPPPVNRCIAMDYDTFFEILSF